MNVFNIIALHPVLAQFIYEKFKLKLEDHSRLVENCRKCLKILESGLAVECQRYILFAERLVEELDIKQTVFCLLL